MKPDLNLKKSAKLIIKKCHVCGQITESEIEQSECPKCGKAFLPLNYFDKIHGDTRQEFKDLFSESSELNESELIIGLYVLW